MRTIDLRSDTVTHPTPEMRRAMAEAEVGDDVLGDDPTVHRLEAMAAERMGKEAAVYVSSGTMGNLLAVLSWCDRGDEVILGSEAHILWHESAGSAAVAGTLLRAVPNDDRGRLDPGDVSHAIRAYRPGVSPTGMVALENTHNRCSGAALTPEDTKEVAEVAHAHGLPLHLDGARIFNAAVAQEIPVDVLAGHADSVTFCFSKGLSAPIGSALCGPSDFIHQARRWRKMLGGGMRQLGVIAAAAIVSLETMVPRLAEDHQNAKRLADGLADIPGIAIDPERIETNIVIFEWEGGPHATFMSKLAEAGVLVSSSGAPKVRMVTHYGINAEDIDDAIDAIRAAAKEAMAA
ncbi:MAG: aminotransferase class I/II-fold pyridoxal phosphate-dependent enzyme [Chloroflexota bacterium]|nr:aminotransferase class I/II-fold pyridoxal phosphate-dependent enzyme [Chloroflexota bacterium]